MGRISMSFSTHVCFPPERWHWYETPASRKAFPESKSTLTTRGWNSGIFVMSMLNAHTASNRALMMTACVERIGCSHLADDVLTKPEGGPFKDYGSQIPRPGFSALTML